MSADPIDTSDERFRSRRAALDANLFNRLFRLTHRSKRQAKRLLDAHGGVNVVEWRILIDLSEAGPLSVRELAELDGTDRSLVSRALPALRDAGLVRLSRDGEDARQVRVALTAKGRRRFERARGPMMARLAALDAAYTPDEKARFLDYLDRMEAVVRAPIERFEARAEDA